MWSSAGHPIVIGLMKANGLKVSTFRCPAAQLIGDINTVKDATKLDFSGLPITSEWRHVHVLPMLQSDVIIIALIPSIGDCTALTALNLGYCRSLAGESNPLCVAPMLHST